MPANDPIFCFCNMISQSTIENAINNGATTLSEIYDKTGAGVGPCGGTCREIIKNLIPEQLSSSEHKSDPSSTKSWDLPIQVIEAISLFNRRYYWETHEILEELWLIERGPLKLFYQGIIQAAATMYHVLNSNPQGVIKLGPEALKKLQTYRPTFHFIHIESLCLKLESYIQQAKEIISQNLVGFDYENLPVILVGSDMTFGES